MYEEYLQVVRSVRDVRRTPFRQQPAYRSVVETVSDEQAIAYQAAVAELGISQLAALRCAEALDAIGGGAGSPTAWRYIHQAGQCWQYIRQHYQPEEAVDIVEIGGGFGGLCFAMAQFGDQRALGSYTLIDLPEVLELQRACLSVLKPHYAQLNLVTAASDFKDVPADHFLIAYYSLAEFPPAQRLRYLELLLPRSRHGLVLWNNWRNEPLDVGRPLLANLPEQPCTAPQNRVLYF